jgi:hypothetical protein
MSPDIGTLITPLIIAIIPIIVMVAKRFIPAQYSFIFPILATTLGPLADYLSTYVTGAPASPVKGLLMGGAAVALREIVDQVKQIQVTKAP